MIVGEEEGLVLVLAVELDQSKRETLLRTIRDGADVTLNMTEDLLDVAAIPPVTHDRQR